MDEQIMADLARRLEPELVDAMQKIRQLLNNERFHDMCSEYEDGAKYLRRVQEGQRRMIEVTELVEGLRQEILRYIKEH